MPTLLSPLAAVYGAVARYRQRQGTPYRSTLPTICVGNLVAGGAGKTPTVIWLCDALASQGYRPGILSRGYGGKLFGPVRVDPAEHSSAEVGDEPLLLAARYPTWISKDRAVGAKVMEDGEVDVIVLDDGFQNPGVVKDFSIIVVDGGFGLGNGQLIPAGPMRETLADGLARADHVLVIGDDERGVLDLVGNSLPVSAGRIEPDNNPVDGAKPCIAFCGIGRPAKFFETVRSIGMPLIQTHSYADHHPYSRQEISQLKLSAKLKGAALMTTEKDLVRINPADREGIEVLKIHLTVADETALLNQIKSVLQKTG